MVAEEGREDLHRGHPAADTEGWAPGMCVHTGATHRRRVGIRECQGQQAHRRLGLLFLFWCEACARTGVAHCRKEGGKEAVTRFQKLCTLLIWRKGGEGRRRSRAFRSRVPCRFGGREGRETFPDFPTLCFLRVVFRVKNMFFELCHFMFGPRINVCFVYTGNVELS